MPTLVLTNFNIVCAALGGFITLFGLVSYLLKERFYLSEARTFCLKLATLPCQDLLITETFSDFPACWSGIFTPRD